MQAMAMRAFVDDLTPREVIIHWLAIEDAARRAVRTLPAGTVALTSLEGLSRHPDSTVSRLLCWVEGGGGAGDSDALASRCGPDQAASQWLETAAAKGWLASVRPRPNERYQSEYAAAMAPAAEEGEAARRAHAALVAEFAEAVGKASGYALADVTRFEEPPARDTAWLERWVRAPGAARGVLLL